MYMIHAKKKNKKIANTNMELKPKSWGWVQVLVNAETLENFSIFSALDNVGRKWAYDAVKKHKNVDRAFHGGVLHGELVVLESYNVKTKKWEKQ